jgi:hypothetical protein
MPTLLAWYLGWLILFLVLFVIVILQLLLFVLLLLLRLICLGIHQLNVLFDISIILPVIILFFFILLVEVVVVRPMQIPVFLSKIPVFVIGLGIIIVGVITGVEEPYRSFVVVHGYNVKRAGKKRTTMMVCNFHTSGFQRIISVLVEWGFQWKEQPHVSVNPDLS